MSLFPSWRSTARRLLRLSRMERELDSEVRAYLDALVDEKVSAGMNREEARRAASMELGGVEQVKEAVREALMGARVENLWKDFVYGARLLAKSPGVTAVAVLTLALGMGPGIAIFSFVDGILLRPLPYPQPERIVQVFQTNHDNGRMDLPVSPPNYADWLAQTQSLERMTAYAWSSEVLTGGVPERVTSAVIAGDFFGAFGVAPILGRPFGADAQQQAAQVILSYGVWQRRLGGRASVVGETISVGARPHTVAGVMPRGFNHPAGAELWVPLVFAPGEMKERNSHYLDVAARLKPGVALAGAQGEMDVIGRRLGAQYPESNKQYGVRVVSLHEEMVRGVRPALGMLFGAVALVLLIACVNVANLLLARGAARQRDMAMRAALGAGRLRLAQQLLSEGFLIAAASGVLGTLVAWWSLDGLRSLSPVQLPRLEAVTLDPRVIAFAVLLMFLTTLLFGLAPAWQAARVQVSESLKEGARGSGGAGHARLRSALVVAEVALSLVLLVGAGLVLRALWGLLSTPPGFDANNVLTADLYLARGKHGEHASRAQFIEAVLEKARAIPGVETASMAVHLPLGGTTMTYGFLMEGDPEKPSRDERTGQAAMKVAGLRLVTSDYLRTMRIPVLRGRGITARDVAGAPEVALVNQAMAAKYWPGADPIGKKVRIARQATGPAWREVVGIVGDVRHHALHKPPEPEIYLALAQQSAHLLRVALRTSGHPAASAQALREAVWAVDKDQPVVRVRPMTAVVLNSVAETRFYGLLLGLFAGLALLLAGAGIFSVMAYVVTQRTREMGIRLALGAQRADVLRMVVSGGMKLALAGVALGLAAGVYATRWVEKLLFSVKPWDAPTFAGASILLLGVAAIACLVPARRATQVDPLVALRHQ